MQIKKLSELNLTDRIKILLHGPSGCGKTSLCATCEGKTLMISAEAGLLSIRNAGADIHVAEVKSIQDIMDIYTTLQAGTEFNWVCLDSISEIAEVVLSNEKKNNKDPRKAYMDMIDQMGDLIRAFRDLPYNVLMTAKQERIKDESNGTLLYMPSMPGAKLAQQLAYWFDEVFAYRIEKDSEGKNVRTLQTGRDATHEAKDRSGSLDPWEDPDITSIARKIRGEKKPNLKTVTGE